MNAEQVQEKLAPRIQSLEEFKSRMNGGMTFAGFIAVALLAYPTYLVFTLPKEVTDQGKQVAVQASRLEASERSQAKLEAQLGDLQKAHETLKDAHNKLRSHVTVLYDRQPKGPPMIEALVVSGIVQSVSPKEISILPPELGEPVHRFLLPEIVPVHIKNKDATIQDVKIGMNAEILLIGGEVKNIDIK